MIRHGQKPPEPGYTQERYKTAQVAIDTTRDLAGRDVVYDLWPIDDPYRDTALCVISALQLKGGRTIEKALMKLPLDQKRTLVEAIGSVIELKVPDINSAYDNVHVIDGIPKLTHQEQIRAIAETAHLIGRHWANRDEDGLGTEERVMGAVHGVLNMFQNGALDRVPGFQLIPIDPQTNEGCIQPVTRDRGEVVEADWNYGEPMHLTYPVDVYGADKLSPPSSLTYRFEEQYETLRGRFRTAAQDLFNQGAF